MKVILLKDVKKVGKKYDVKEVSEGFASNLLFPRKEAMIATPENIKKIELVKKQDLQFKKIDEDLLKKNLEVLAETVLEILGKVNDVGHLFAGIHKDQLLAELSAQKHIDLQPDFVKLDKPIKEAGDHIIEVEAHGRKVSFKLVVKKLD